MAKAQPAPRVGILVECGRDGLEVHLCRRICRLLREQHDAVFAERIVPMNDKRSLLEEGVTVVSGLFREGCDRVIVLWDEEPAWPDKEEPLCWKLEKDVLLQATRDADLDLSLIHLVCIERAFESWLMYDQKLLSAVLSRLPAHPVRARPPANPDRINNVKGAMIRLFRQHGQIYSDVGWARRLADNLENLKKLRRCKTFKRFAERVAAKTF